jgi:hypothetical protein
LSSSSAPVAKILRPNFSSRQPIHTNLISSQVTLLILQNQHPKGLPLRTFYKNFIRSPFFGIF